MTIKQTAQEWFEKPGATTHPGKVKVKQAAQKWFEKPDGKSPRTRQLDKAAKALNLANHPKYQPKPEEANPHPTSDIACLREIVRLLGKVVPPSKNAMIDWAVKSQDSVYTNAGAAYRVSREYLDALESKSEQVTPMTSEVKVVLNKRAGETIKPKLRGGVLSLVDNENLHNVTGYKSVELWLSSREPFSEPKYYVYYITKEGLYVMSGGPWQLKKARREFDNVVRIDQQL